MEIIQSCLNDLLRAALLLLITGIGFLARKYLIPILKNQSNSIKQKIEEAGIKITTEQLNMARGIIKEMVSSAYRLKIGHKIDDPKIYVNNLAKEELNKIGINISDNLIDEIRRAALSELELTIEEMKQ